MKAVKFELAGQVRYLSYTVEAMFQIQEQFGGPSGLIEVMRDAGRPGFSAACKAAAILAEQGELGRRNLGYDPEPLADEAAIAASLHPDEIVALKLAIPAAMSLGYGREVEPENDEIDLGLVELNAQKKKPDTPGAIHPYRSGLRAVQERHPPLHPGGGGGSVGAVPPGPWGEAEDRK